MMANMTGSDITSIVIGKSKNTRPFRGKTITSRYYCQPKAWMNSEIFDKELKLFNARIKRENRRVLLFLDNFSGHNTIVEFENVGIVYFPPNTTSITQPCDQGIIRSFKAKYRHQMLKRMLIELDKDDDPNVMVNTKLININDAVQMIADATNSLTSTCVVNCFKKSGFSVELCYQTEAEEENLSQVWSRIIASGQTTEFGNVNDYIDCDTALDHHESTSDEDILSCVKQAGTELTPIEDEDENVIEKVSRQDAIKAFYKFKSFCFNGSIHNSISQALKDAENFLSNDIMSNPKQQKITDYFSINQAK